MRQSDPICRIEGGFSCCIAAPSRRGGPTAVDQNPEQPSPEAIRLSTTFDRTVGPEEGILERLLGVALVAEQMKGIAAEAKPVTDHERRVGLPVAPAHPLDEVGI